MTGPQRGAEPGTPRISLALAIHNHQPVGNFGWVIAEVFDQAYLPMVEALERHPAVKMSLHYTGPLLEWFSAERPEFLERIRALIARVQVELLGGGYFEPVLASLPASTSEAGRSGSQTRSASHAPRGRVPVSASSSSAIRRSCPTRSRAGNDARTGSK